MIFNSTEIKQLEERIAKLEGTYFSLSADDVTKALAYLIDSGRVTFQTSPPNLQFNVEGSDVNKIYALIAELQNKFGHSANLNITANLKVD